MTITFKQLLRFVQFDLSNVFFTLGDTVLKQINGIPMGSPNSPALAIIVCAHAEHLFACSITDFAHYFAKRYMDDIHLTVFYPVADRHASSLAHNFLSDFASIYPSSLTLEHTGSGSTDFLESTISYPDYSTPECLSLPSSSMFCRYFIKNGPSLTSPILKFSRLQHFASYRSLSHRRGSLVGTLLRITTHSCSSPSLAPMFLSTLLLLGELHKLDFPARFLHKTISRLSLAHPHPIWDATTTLLASPQYPAFISTFLSLLPTS